jgi:hypothetical protein
VETVLKDAVKKTRSRCRQYHCGWPQNRTNFSHGRVPGF